MNVSIGNDWDNLIHDEFEKPYYKNLRKLLIEEYKNYEIFPDMYEIFSSIKEVPFNGTKVVIIGQDPYHGPGQAHGFSFSVKPGIRIPPSLLNIYKELNRDLGCYIPDNGYLLKWAKQGVLLLNTTLTVRRGSPNSHGKIGWNYFTDRIIMELNNRDKPIVFLLWGRHAQDKSSLITNNNHLILKSTHPSPFSAHRGFLGCSHFSAANSFLVKNDMEAIDWQIENIGV